MKPLVHFAHANGFPSACYAEFFEALGSDIDLVYIPKIGHDHRYSYSPNWHGLADEIADSVRRQADGRQVIALGHSIGGMTSFMSAHRYPELYRGIIMMDPAYVDPWRSSVFTIAKLLGRVDDVTPARFSKGRRAHWPDAETMYNSLRFKGLFKAFTETSFRNYQQHGLEPAPDGGVRLAFDPSVEVELFRNTPSDTWRYNHVLAMPRAVITGRDSEFYRGGTMTSLAKRQRVPLELVVGAHMFPLEYPQETADLVRKHIFAMHNGTHESSTR